MADDKTQQKKASSRNDLLYHTTEKSKGSCFRHDWVQISKMPPRIHLSSSGLALLLLGGPWRQRQKLPLGPRLIPISVTGKAGEMPFLLSDIAVLD